MSGSIGRRFRLHETLLHQHRRILVVEDNPDAALSLQRLLELKGFDVQIAHTGPEGVRLARSWAPDVVISDIGLPGLDGYQVGRKLRETSEALLIAWTGYNVDDVRDQVFEAGFNHLLSKTDEPELLLELIT
jgi:CheY-like chemotaxis protein